MAANSVTSYTGTVTSADPAFIVAHKMKANSGVVLMIKYTLGTSTSITITFDVLNPSLNSNANLTSTDKYRMISLSGTTVSSYTMVISAAGNYRIPLAITSSESIIYANITFNQAGVDGVVIADFVEGA